MKCLVTGSKGFIGKNLIIRLKLLGHLIYEYDSSGSVQMLETYAKDCDIVFHLAGVNRSDDEELFQVGNVQSTQALIDALKAGSNKAPVVYSSSIWAETTGPYGQSKKQAENILTAYSQREDVPVYLFQLPGVFGKWCRPNYNSVVATFCYNAAHGIPLQYNDAKREIILAYIEDVLDAFEGVINGSCAGGAAYCTVPQTHTITLEKLAQTIQSFADNRKKLYVPEVGDPLTYKLWSTFLTYYSAQDWCYPLTTHTDHRGSFTEMLRSQAAGQVSINIIKPGITKGNHWHSTKTEKFIVISGHGRILFRRIDSDEIIHQAVNSKPLSVIDIPAGYIHGIVNDSAEDMVVLVWSSECYDPETSDTFHEEV